MTVTQLDPGPGDTRTDDLRWILSALTRIHSVDDADRVDQLDLLESIKGAAAGAQASVTVDLAASQRAVQEDLRDAARAAGQLPPARGRIGAGIAQQVALARRESPTHGARHLALAQALEEMPHTRCALRLGEISEWRATLMVRETACLSREDRATVDAELGSRPGGLRALGDRQTEHEARKVAYRLDPHAATRRAARAAADRRVSLRPAPDTMAHLSALLTARDGITVYADLGRHADTLRAAGDRRSRGQIMADTLVQRLTGHPATAAVTAAVTAATVAGAAAAGADTAADGAPPAAAGRARATGRPTIAGGRATHPTPTRTDHASGADAASGGALRRAGAATPTSLASPWAPDHATADTPATRAATTRTPSTRIPTTHTSTTRTPSSNRNSAGEDPLPEGPPGQGVGLALQLVMTEDALLGVDNTAAELLGYGPVPAPLARAWLLDDDTAVWLRRLYAAPSTGQLVAMESRHRAFGGALRQLIEIRDLGACRTPWCDAPLRHTDHAVRDTDGGPTSARNGQGLCEACNQAKEAPGWHARSLPPSGRDEPGGGPAGQAIVTTTPTGHAYTSPVPRSVAAPPTPPLPIPCSAGPGEPALPPGVAYEVSYTLLSA